MLFPVNEQKPLPYQLHLPDKWSASRHNLRLLGLTVVFLGVASFAYTKSAGLRLRAGAIEQTGIIRIELPADRITDVQVAIEGVERARNVPAIIDGLSAGTYTVSLTNPEGEVLERRIVVNSGFQTYWETPLFLKAKMLTSPTRTYQFSEQSELPSRIQIVGAELRVHDRLVRRERTDIKNAIAVSDDILLYQVGTTVRATNIIDGSTKDLFTVQSPELVTLRLRHQDLILEAREGDSVTLYALSELPE